jgi:predicted CXXCH cytochrome family protein
MIQVGAGLLLMVAIASPVYGQAYTPGNGIADSPHDFSDGETVTGTLATNDEGTWNPNAHICEVCHTPHNAPISIPLWDHAVPLGSTFTPYDSPTINANSGTVPNPAGISLNCLGCHDGATNIDAFGGAAGTVTIGGTTPTYPAVVDFGVDLSNDHPISITYNAALVTADNNGVHNPTTTSSGITGGANIDDDMLFGTGNDQLECASCHDVHNGVNTVAKLLVKGNTSSALCLTCHNK